MKNTDDPVIYSNVRIDKDSSYIFFVGDQKYIDTSTLLSENLEKRYKRPLEIINILPNMPSPYMRGNFIVINSGLLTYQDENPSDDTRYFLPLDQPDINADVCNSRYIDRVIDQILDNQDDLFINLFKNSPEMDLPEKDQRIKTIGPDPKLYVFLDDKLNQWDIMQKLGIPQPRGYPVEGFDELVRMYAEKFYGPAFVTCSHGFGGNGTQPISCLDDLAGSEKLKGRDRFIISDLLTLGSSPFTMGIVANEDEVFVASVADQIMDGVDYAGSVYPSDASPGNVRLMKDYTEMIGRYIGGLGYRGCFGIDFMIDTDDNLYFVEINPRKIGSTPEIILSYWTEDKKRLSLAELEFLAVTQGTFGVDLGGYTMPKIHWGLRSIKARQGETTTRYFSREKTLKHVFENTGYTIIDHPGDNVHFIEGGRLAKIVCVSDADDHRAQILRTLDEKQEQIRQYLTR